MRNVWESIPWSAIAVLGMLSILGMTLAAAVRWRQTGSASKAVRSAAWFGAAASALFAVLVTTIGRLPTGIRGEFVNFVPLRTISHQLTAGGALSFVNLITNIVILVPLGFFVALASRSVVIAVVAGFVVSFGIEVTQYFTTVGSADVDDLLLNVCGAALGATLWLILRPVLFYEFPDEETRTANAHRPIRMDGKILPTDFVDRSD